MFGVVIQIPLTDRYIAKQRPIEVDETFSC